MAIVVKEDETQRGAPNFREMTAKDIGFRDPLSDTTRRTRAQLVFAGAFAVLVQVYDLTITKTPWLQIEVPERAPQLLDGALSVAVAYLFIVFAVYVFMDLSRWQLRGKIHIIQSSSDMILNLRNDTYGIRANLDRFTPPYSDAANRVIVNLSVLIPQRMAQLEEIRGGLSRLTRVQWFRVIGIELGVPLALGWLAIWKTSHAIIPFLQAVLL